MGWADGVVKQVYELISSLQLYVYLCLHDQEMPFLLQSTFDRQCKELNTTAVNTEVNVLISENTNNAKR